MPEQTKPEEYILGGKFGRTYGLKGELRVFSYTDPIDNLFEYFPWYQKTGSSFLPISVEYSKPYQNSYLIKLTDYHTPEDAQVMVNQSIYFCANCLPKLQTDEFYWHDLIGLAVINQNQSPIGHVKQIIPTGSNDVLVISHEGQRWLLPILWEVAILKVDLENRTITINDEMLVK